MIKKRYLQGRV